MPTTQSSSTSVSLVDGIQPWREDDWERYVELYSPMLTRWCLVHGLHGNDAADVIQEVHLAVWQHIDNFKHEGGQHSFSRLALHDCEACGRNFYRKRNRERNLSEEAAAANTLQSSHHAPP
ncbi:MAG: sigma-70 family RNA polymerase sigma factor [Planctomycetia bacterium]|nr:sigma-70 family RNA polymerase sigma factor [Planctomycetia bacterium]